MKKLIRRLLWLLGYDIQPLEVTGSMARLLFDTVRASKPNFFIDVGANVGQSALEFLYYWPDCKIVSFEPLTEAHAIATEVSKNYPSWKVYPRMALGDAESEVTINVSANGLSSSLLDMKKLHQDAAPESVYVKEESTPIRRLDQTIERNPENRYYLKIDTQGYELNVLRGCDGILDQIVAVQLELSWDELYAGQPMAMEVVSWLLDKGFKPYGFGHMFREKNSGRLLQMEGYFIR
jgi:FkbM family methyltransferase